MADFGSSDLFSNFEEGAKSFTEAVANATAFGDHERRRESWPILDFRDRAEVEIRILPIRAVKSAFHWIPTRAGNKRYPEDCPAFDAYTGVSQGRCPACEAEFAQQRADIVYVIDLKAKAFLDRIGCTPDKYEPYKKGQGTSMDNPIMHPYRIMQLSSAILNKLQPIMAKRGAANDLTQGYSLIISKLEKSGKIDYMPQFGQVIPLDAETLRQDLIRLQLPDSRQYHEPSSPAEIIKSLFFNGHLTYEKASEKLRSYETSGLIEGPAVGAVIKAMQTYMTNHGMAAAEPLSASPLPAPSLEGSAFGAPAANAPASNMPAAGSMVAPAPMGAPAMEMPPAAPAAPAMQVPPPMAPAPAAPSAPAMDFPVAAPAPVIPPPMAPAPATPAPSLMPPPAPMAPAPMPPPMAPAAPMPPAAPVPPAPMAPGSAPLPGSSLLN